MPIGYHVNFALTDRRVLSRDAASHRRAARSVLAAARPFDLLAFRVADNHVHMVVTAEGSTVAEAVRRVKIALHQALGPGVPFGTTHYESLAGQTHLDRAFRYVLRQSQRHGFDHDPLAEASNLPDLLGLRLIGSWTVAHVRSRLPRVGRPGLLAILGVDALEDKAAPLQVLAESTMAAAALATLEGRGDRLAVARCAAVHAAAEATNKEVAATLMVTPRAVQRMRRQEADPGLVRAIRLQADLRGRRDLVEPAAFVGESPLEYRVGF